MAVADAIPGAGVNADAATKSLNIVHVGEADWRYGYAGECGPTGVALRHALVDLSGPAPNREVVDHKLACPLEPGAGYEIRVDATASDGTRHRAVVGFGAAPARAAPGVAVLDSRTLSRSGVDRLFRRYVRDAVVAGLDVPVVDALAALIIAAIADRVWTELGVREAQYATESHAVTYASRSPSGGAATLTGLVAMPRPGDGVAFEPLDRVVVLKHATGSTPSRLDRDDGWYVLANLLAGRGYLVLAPDNWGRGAERTANRPETYLMANRVANNGLDLVRQALADRRYRPYRPASETVGLTVVGYSQGGHGAVALLLAAAAVDDAFAVREVYAGGAPHDLYRTFRGGPARAGR